MTSRRRAGIRVNQRNRRRGATAITSITRRLQVAEHHQIPPPSLKCVFRSIRPGIPVQSGQLVRSISAKALGCGRARVGSVSVVTRSGSRRGARVEFAHCVDDWGKLLGDTAAVTALLDRLLHHAHVLTCGPRSWRTKLHAATDPSVTVPR